MRRAIAIAGGFIVCVACAASAQTSGSIAGTVTAAADASPIVGAIVNAYDANRSIVSSVVTDASGIYTISNLLPGTFYLRFSRTGFVPIAFDNVPCAAQSCFAGGVLGLTPTPVMVTGTTTTTVNVALDRGATIAGTVKRASDGMVPIGALVRLYDASTSPVATATTAVDGSYSFSGIPFGTYFARTDGATRTLNALDELYGGTLCPGGSMPRCRIDSGTPIVVSPGAPSATANFALPIGGTILGALSGGHPGDGSSFFKYPLALYQGTTLVGTTTANSGGGYGFAGLDPGTYFVRTNAGNDTDIWYSASQPTGVCVACPGVHPSPVTVSAATITGGINFLIASSLGTGISGTLTLHGVSNVTGALTPNVQIYNTDGTLVQTWSGVQTTSGTGDTIPWNVTIAPGTYYVRTSSYSLPAFQPLGLKTFPASGYWIDTLYDGKTCVAADCDPRTGTPVVVNSGAVTSGIDFALDFGAIISGTLDAGFVPGSTLVEVYDARGVRLPQRSGTQSGESSSHTYAALGLPAGTYYLVATSLPTGVSRILYDSLACAGCAVTAGTPVVVGLGDQKTGVNFPVIAERTISGTVQSNASAVLANQPLSTIGVEAYAPNGQLASSTTTLADGTYTIHRLGPGTYTIRTHNARGFVDQTYGTPVVVSSGSDVTGIDFVLAQGQTVSGQLSAAGAPLVATGVLVYPSSPASPAAHVTTDATGFFQANVPAGSYFVQTDPAGGFTQQIYNGVACPQGVCPTGSATAVTVASIPVTGINFYLPVCTAPSIAPVRLAQGAVGIAYRQTLLASGATGAVTFTVPSGALPPGVTIDPTTGVVSGTPTASGQFTFTIAATDASGCVGSRSYTLDVPACVVNLPSSMPTPSPGGGFYIPFRSTCDTLAASANVSWITSTVVSRPSLFPNNTNDLYYLAQANSGPPRQGTITVGSRTITIFQSGVPDSPPFGAVDAPADGAIVSGSVAISGWALDDYGSPGVALYRDPVAGEPPSLVPIGLATFVSGARPDVAAAYPAYQSKDRAGWGYLLLTNMLPNHGNGTFRIWVVAYGSGPGCFLGRSSDCVQTTVLGTRVINCVNSTTTAPFGAIDTPGQGATISGSAFVNFGWALTPQPKMIPFDGSTIKVLIDGVDVGSVTAYDFFRSDVSTLFPGLKNSAGPVGYRIIDTTALSEGPHTIAWLATDDGGITTGIGSRYFTVQNSAWTPSLRANFTAAPVPPRVDGVDLGRKAASLASVPTDGRPEGLRYEDGRPEGLGYEDGARTVTMSNLQALELSLTKYVAQAFRPADTCAATYAGYLVVNGELTPLPIGSSLDPAGTFYWHPGPGYFGTYQLVFVRTACDGTQQRIPVSVQIR